MSFLKPIHPTPSSLPHCKLLLHIHLPYIPQNFPFLKLTNKALRLPSRYEISTTAAAVGQDEAWAEAERQVREGRNSTVVSVKSGKSKKRKIEEGDDVADAEDGAKKKEKREKKERKGGDGGKKKGKKHRD